MAYNPTIAGTDRIKNSRPQIQTNFQDIEAWTAVDHETFGSPFEGMHAQVTFPINATPTIPAAGQILLWCDTNPQTTNPELYYANGTSGLVWPLTASGNSLGQGYTFLPGGLLLKWGSQTQAGMTGGPFNYVFPAVGNSVPFSQIYTAMAWVGATNNVGTDVNAIAYVTNFTVPTRITYTVWRRNLFNTPGTDHPPYIVLFLAIGAP